MNKLKPSRAEEKDEPYPEYPVPAAPHRVIDRVEEEEDPHPPSRGKMITDALRVDISRATADPCLTRRMAKRCLRKATWSRPLTTCSGSWIDTLPIFH